MSTLSVACELVERLRSTWSRIARHEQLPPAGDWDTWAFVAGRGAGKTRAGAEQVCAWARSDPGCRIALVGPTAADVRDVMIDGESGLLAVYSGLTYEPSKRRVVWPNGSRAYAYSAEEPARLRGPQHGYAWADEAAVWAYPESWDMLQLGLRLGARPRCVVTTTPRPVPLVRRLLSASDGRVAVTRCSTFANAANLPESFLAAVRSQYEGTRMGRQELHAELLDDTEGALWTRAMIDATRARTAPVLQRVVVAIDPAVTSRAESDETGIIVAGRAMDGQLYVLADYSGRYSPDGWARRAVAAFAEHHADRVIAEVNNGGDMVEHTLRTVAPQLAYYAVHASRGKVVRAEPVAALYEQGKVHHVGEHRALEEQLCSWSPAAGSSPDRLDALVWACTALMDRVVPNAYSRDRKLRHGMPQRRM